MTLMTLSQSLRIVRENNLKIGGLNKTTLLDYPERVAATIFTVGCNLRCPFCHNSDLICDRDFPHVDLIAESEIFDFLRNRKNVLSGLCISGGEPTLQPDLAEFIRQVKKLGYSVKLDTNGLQPDVISDLLRDELVDYIAMDVKSSKDGYRLISGLECLDLSKIEASVDIIKQASIDYEFRTTVVREFHSADELAAIGRWLDGSTWFLQGFEDNEKVLKRGLSGYSGAEIDEMVRMLLDARIAVKLRAV